MDVILRYNGIVTLLGADNPGQYIVLCSHLRDINHCIVKDSIALKWLIYNHRLIKENIKTFSTSVILKSFVFTQKLSCTQILLAESDSNSCQQ